MSAKAILFFILFSAPALAQFNTQGFDNEEDLDIGGDIFSDFNEDLEAAQVMEDERFYRYSRFFSLTLGIGMTDFTGNRGLAYQNNPPSFGLGLLYFLDFQNVFTMGFQYSRHTMFIDTHVVGHPNQVIGAVETSLLRPYFGFRYYMDTSDLGTAITYSNPYFIGRVEYWYQTNRFAERDNLSDETGGGVGLGIGAGLEFPIEIKKTYFNVEFLFHTVNFFDKYTQDYRRIEPGSRSSADEEEFPSTYGYEDLTGNVMTMFVNYVISW